MERAPIVFESVWKKFRRGERHDSLRDLIPSIVRRVSGRAVRDADGTAAADIRAAVSALVSRHPAYQRG